VRVIDINKRKEQRFQFLHKLYELTGGSELKRLRISEISESLGIEKKDENNICQYLKGEDLAKPVNMTISITHYGIVQIEGALSKPDEATEYFPPVNIINIHQMSNSVIQQGNVKSTQSVIFEEKTINDLKEFLLVLREKLPELSLSSEDQTELNADISTIEAQTDSSKPKKGIIKESLLSVQRIIEGATGAVVAQQLLPYIPPLLALFK